MKTAGSGRGRRAALRALAILAMGGALLAGGAGCAAAARRMGLPDLRKWTVQSGDGASGPAKPRKKAPAPDPAETERARMAFFREGWTCEGDGDHWLQIDWGRPAMVYGFDLRWGEVFPADYDVLLSRDGKRWETVREKRGGKGGSDFWVLEPRPVRAVRLVAKGKGKLSWMRIISVDTRPQVRVDGLEFPGTAALLDGDAATQWTFGGAGGGDGGEEEAEETAGTEQTVEIAVDWGAPREMHGVEIDWAEGAPRPDSVEVSASADGMQWAVLGAGAPSRDEPCDVWVTETPRRVRRVKLLARHGGAGFVLAGVSLRGPGEAAATWNEYAAAHQALRDGSAEAPGVFAGQAPRWTVAAGLEETSAEALLSTEGAWSAGRGAPSLWPLAWTSDGRVLAPRGAAESATGTAEPGVPMPTAEWTWEGGLKLSIRVMAAEDGGSWAEYVWENAGEEPAEGRLGWLLRPLRIPPPEAGGGLAPIAHVKPAAAAGADGAEWREIRVNGAPLLGAPGTNLAFAAAASVDGGPSGLASGAAAGTARAVRDRKGLAEALWTRPFRLAPGEKVRTVLAQGPWPPKRGEKREWPADPAGRFDAEWRERAWAWKLACEGYAPSIERPARTDLARAQLAWVLGARSGAESPEEALWRLETMLCAGRLDKALGVVSNWIARAEEALDMDGAEEVGSRRMAADRERATLSPEVCGQFVFGVMETWRFAGDDDFLEGAYPVLRRAMLDMAALTEAMPAPPSALRRFWLWLRPWRRKPPEVGPSFGLVADRAAGAGGEAVHPTTAQLWALLGWKELRRAAKRLGFEEDAAWADSQYRALREAFRRAVGYATRESVHPRIPPSIESPDGPGGTAAAAILFWPCGEGDLLPAAMVQNTLDTVYARYLRWIAPREGPGAGEKTMPAAAWIGDVRYLTSFSRMGHADYAREMLFTYADLCEPHAWGALPAVTGGEGMPAAWRPDVQTASLFYLAMRQLAVCEDGGRLHLLCGLPPEWVQQGRGFRVAGALTAWGALDVDAVLRRRLWRVKIGGTARPPDGFRLWWPLGERPERVLLNRTAARDDAFDLLGIDLPGDFSGTVEAFFAEDVPVPREP